MNTWEQSITTLTFGPWIAGWVAVLFFTAWMILFMVNRGNFRRTLRSRVATILLGWLIIIPLYLAGVFLPLAYAMLFVYVILALAVREAVQLITLPRMYEVSLYLLTAATVVVAAYFPTQYLILPLAYFLVLSALPVQSNDAAHGFVRVSHALFILFWIVFFGGHILLLGHLDFALGLERALVGSIVLAVSLSDVGAFLVGKGTAHLRSAQRARIAPAISPNKHWIGLMGHIGGAWVGLLICGPFLTGVLTPFELGALGVFVGVFGMLGGLMNSLVKRTFGAKDSGTLLPGHGGVLDRIDSLVRVAGVSYYVLVAMTSVL